MLGGSILFGDHLLLTRSPRRDIAPAATSHVSFEEKNTDEHKSDGLSNVQARLVDEVALKEATKYKITRKKRKESDKYSGLSGISQSVTGAVLLFRQLGFQCANAFAPSVIASVVAKLTIQVQQFALHRSSFLALSQLALKVVLL